MRALLATAIAATLVLTIAPAAQAQIIVDVGSSGVVSAGLGGLIMGTDRTGANNFTLGSAATIRGASFFSQECCNAPWSGTLQYSFFNASGSLPGSTPITTGLVSQYLTTTVYSDGATNLIRRFDFNLNAPLTLAAGSYAFGLSVASSAPTAGSLAWRMVETGGGISELSFGSTYTNWAGQYGDAAFQLTGSTFEISAVPEPATVVLLASGLAMLGGLATRRRRSAR